MARIIPTGNPVGQAFGLRPAFSRLFAANCNVRRGRLRAGCGLKARPTAQRGFTMIELMIVMAIVVILISIAVPLYQKALLRAKETILKNNLFTIRTVIDEYTYDKQKAPQTLQDMVTEGYLREVPIDPIVGNNTSWRYIMEQPLLSVSQTEPGIFDVRSASDGKSLEGTLYSDW
jgi:general secretion pathway protein G